MLHKTRGIVLHTMNYSESSVIAKIYTESFGLQSYLINGVKNKKAKIKNNILQPLSLLDLVVYHKEKSGLQRISEAKPAVSFHSIPYDIAKSTVSLFLNEVLFKAIKEEDADQNLFEFIYHSICILDLENCPTSHFHLFFMVQLTRYLGFFPLGTYSSVNHIFNLKEGTFQSHKPLHPYFLEPPLSEHIFNLSVGNFETLDQISIPKNYRKELIYKLVDYFSLHISGFSNFKSLTVLEDVMS